MTTLDFNLVNIITNAGGDPGDVTDAVWDAGYQRMNFTIEEIIQMTTEQIGFCVCCSIPQNVWPTTVEDLSKGNLNTIIDDAMSLGVPAEVAAMVLKNGYVKGGDK
ncbi:hypothetical protein GKR48_06785 [Providencia sp. wls1943]|uniref:hypothetical protein n=1 Tax=Providencia sp. wls1943 TaxID=2675150 RepID=UPI0012B5C9C9|nr:hypothetical protein [Providencia sp. wls1943]